MKQISSSSHLDQYGVANAAKIPLKSRKPNQSAIFMQQQSSELSGSTYINKPGRTLRNTTNISTDKLSQRSQNKEIVDLSSYGYNSTLERIDQIKK